MFSEVSDTENLCVKENRGMERENDDLRCKFFFVSVPNVFVGEPFNVSLISGIEQYHG